MSEVNSGEPRGYRERAGKRGKTRREILGMGTKLAPILPDKPKPAENSPLQTTITRRNLLKGAAAAMGVAGLGAIGMRMFGRENRSDEARYYQTRLAELDKKITDIESFEEIAPSVGDLAVEYFSKEMGYDASSYQGRLHFLRNSEYLRKRQETSGCIETQTKEDEYAFVNVSSQDMVFNLSLYLVYNARNNKLISRDHAQQLFVAVLHELHHVSAPILQQMDAAIPIRWRGLGFLEPKPEESKPDNLCYNLVRLPLEEAIVTDSTNFMVERLGLTNIAGEHSEKYKQWAERYRKGVIDKLFGGDHKPLLNLHQQTRQHDFFSLIGEKLEVPADQRANVGEEYVHRVLTEGR